MLRPGDSFDKYVVERLLGSGGMGEVYVVHHRRTKKRGALKIVLPHLLTDPTTVERFLQEAQIGARIEDATHIVDVLDAGRDEAGSPWLVMEYLSGRDLGQILDRVRTLEPETLVEVLRQTAEALDSAHAKGVVHRDIKPENLFIQARPGRPNVVKVLDFGIAKILEQATHTGTTAGGTIAYMAPEQGDGRAAVGPRADIWPLGLIAYRALVGTPYWLGESAFAIMKELVADDLAKASERAREQGAVVPLFDHAGDAFDDFFVRCVNRDPEARFATAGGAVTALAAALGVTRRTPLVIPEASASEPTAPPPRPAAESASGAPESAARTAAASETLGPTSTARLQGADVDAEVRGAEARYREERAKRLRLFLKLSVIPALVVAGVSFALWYEGHTTDRARRDAWASFLACALGKVPEKDEAVSELRRRLDLQKTLNRLEGARRGAPLPSSEAKSDLLGCVRYARVVADLVDRASTHAQSFAKQMDALARPADIPNEGVAAALENALDGSSGLGLDGGKVDPKLTPPQLTTAALDMEAPGSQPISANASDDLGTTKLRGGGIRRRTFRTTRSMIVCDFSKAGMDCATYSAPKGSIGAVVSSPPLGDVVLVATDHGLALLPRVGPERPILDLPDLWQGTHAGRDEPRFVRGDRSAARSRSRASRRAGRRSSSGASERATGTIHASGSRGTRRS
ncbi:MAG: serine/threonine-protein kinase [Polyangiaceae bacterium]